jgi:FkbH-like protein
LSPGRRSTQGAEPIHSASYPQDSQSQPQSFVKLLEALNAVKSMQSEGGPSLPCALVTGFTPLHLKTFLTAQLAVRLPGRTIAVQQGLYGDLAGNLRRLQETGADFGVVVVEWSDLDPRLGIRSTARWSNSELTDILATAKARADQILQAAEAGAPIALSFCLPTLPLLPLSFTPGWQSSAFEFDLRGVVQSLASSLARAPHIGVLSAQQLDLQSPPAERFDVVAEMQTGFPYRLAHASALAALLATLALRSAPKKGLITDLDETLWKGILGEDGVDGVSWDLEHHSQIHAFYQRFLGSLASAGVLLAAASKNDPALVEEAFSRTDLAVSPSTFFPVEAHWKPKSESVARILDSWNIGADAVVFVDDSPLELAEVQAAHPGIECLRFPAGNDLGVYTLIRQLRDKFGKSAIAEEDTLRLESIRRARSGGAATLAAGTDFLDHTEAEVTFSFTRTPADPRALELVNKTNQFNLNGARYTEASWHKLLSGPDAFLMVVSYRDKFGPLGKIAVMAGAVRCSRISVSTWVMSCRAFSRRIEHRCLAELLARFDAAEVEFDYRQTERNGPLRDFLGEALGAPPAPGCIVSREMLEARLNTTPITPEMIHG